MIKNIFNKIIILVIPILLLYACIAYNKSLKILNLSIQYKKPSEITEQYVKEWINEVKDKEEDFFIAKSHEKGKEIYYLYLDPDGLSINNDKQYIYVSWIEKGISNPEDKRIFIIKMKEKRKPKAIIIEGEVIPTESIREIGIKE